MPTFESACLLFNMGIDATSVDPDQTAPIGSGSSLFVKEASKCLSRQQKHTTFCNMRFKD